MPYPRTNLSTDAPADRHEERVTLDLDLAALAGALGRRLYDAGVSVTPAQSQRYALSLQLVRPSTLRELYFTTRSIFVTDADEMGTFDRVFADVFDAAGSHPDGYDADVVAFAAANAS